MNDPLGQLEEELGKLRPREPSAALKGALATRLAKNESVFRWWVAGGLAVAACWLAVILFRPGLSGTGQDRTDPIAGPPVIVSAEDPPPTLIAYQLAARESLEALDVLLDKHADELWVTEAPFSMKHVIAERKTR